MSALLLETLQQLPRSLWGWTENSAGRPLPQLPRLPPLPPLALHRNSSSAWHKLPRLPTPPLRNSTWERRSALRRHEHVRPLLRQAARRLLNEEGHKSTDSFLGISPPHSRGQKLPETAGYAIEGGAHVDLQQLVLATAVSTAFLVVVCVLAAFALRRWWDGQQLVPAARAYDNLAEPRLSTPDKLHSGHTPQQTQTQTKT
jgi:hypothetical protein